MLSLRRALYLHAVIYPDVAAALTLMSSTVGRYMVRTQNAGDMFFLKTYRPRKVKLFNSLRCLLGTTSGLFTGNSELPSHFLAASEIPPDDLIEMSARN